MFALTPNRNRRAVMRCTRVSLIAVLLAGCSGVGTPRTPAPVVMPVPAPVTLEPAAEGMAKPEMAEDASAPDVAAIPTPVAPPAAAPPTPVAPQVSAAVLALLEQARREAGSGAADRAVATLERAIRIEPANPWLWHRLAVLRLQQRQWGLARGLAEKSNSLARGNSRLLAGNWRVIADALAAQGDHAAAASADARSSEYFSAPATAP